MSPAHGGVFDMLRRLVSLGLGGAMGPGDQFVSWVHDQDFVRAIEFLISSGMEGPINVSAPCPLSNAEFMRVLREAYGISFGLSAEPWMLEIGAFFLRTETELILKSRRVMPGRLLGSGFTFNFPEWSEAAQDLVRRWCNCA